VQQGAKICPLSKIQYRSRDTAGNRDNQPAVFSRGRFFQPAHAAEFGIDLFGGLFADVAGVEDDEVGILHCSGLDIAVRRQRVCHPTRVVDVHLAAERFDVELAGF